MFHLTRKALTWTIKPKLDFRIDPKFPSLNKTLLLDEKRGLRAPPARALSYGTPAPA